MPVTLRNPGVYIEEVQSSVHTIVGVPTSVAAFVGYAAQGPVDDPVQVNSWADYERSFGGLDPYSAMSYAVSSSSSTAATKPRSCALPSSPAWFPR